MSVQPDVVKPINDPYSLLGENWPVELESSYHAAEDSAHDASTRASAQAQSATDAESKMADEKGRAADAVLGGYSNAATQLHEQSISYVTIGSWMNDAASKVRTAKTDISDLVTTGTQEIRDALDSEIAGTPVTPSSTALTDKYRNDIAAVATKLTIDLDAIGHSLAGDPGASTTPTYVRAAASSTAPTVEQAAVHRGITGEGPHAEPHQLPEMPRATSPSGVESSSTTSTPGTPSAPIAPTHAVNPTLSNLVSGSAPSGTPSSPSASSAKSSSGPTSGTPAGQGAQANETHQDAKSPALPRIPSVPLPDLPAAAESIATAVTSAASGQQLPTTTAPTTPGSPQTPSSTGFTPGISGPAPIPPAGLAPIGGGLPTAPVVQGSPASQGASPTSPPPGVQAPAPAQTPAPAPRGPVADLAWIQKSYGLSPSLELSKSENPITPALFIASLPESEAHLHRVLATLRHQFESAGLGQPIAVASITRGFEHRTVYVTSDGLSIHPHGVLLPEGVIPLDEMPSAPTAPEMLGSLMVTDKLRSLLPRNWEVESLLSTVSGGGNSQSAEEFQALVESGELLSCRGVRGRSDVTDDEALRVFARVAIGSRTGCGELEVESARIRAARWVGVQPAGYLDLLARYHLADAAESMSRGLWGEAVYAAEKYMSVQQSKAQAA